MTLKETAAYLLFPMILIYALTMLLERYSFGKFDRRDFYLLPILTLTSIAVYVLS